MARTGRCSPEVRERAVRMVFEHEREHSSQRPGIVSITGKMRGAVEKPHHLEVSGLRR